MYRANCSSFRFSDWPFSFSMNVIAGHQKRRIGELGDELDVRVQHRRVRLDDPVDEGGQKLVGRSRLVATELHQFEDGLLEIQLHPAQALDGLLQILIVFFVPAYHLREPFQMQRLDHVAQLIAFSFSR